MFCAVVESGQIASQGPHRAKICAHQRDHGIVNVPVFHSRERNLLTKRPWGSAEAPCADATLRPALVHLHFDATADLGQHHISNVAVLLSDGVHDMFDPCGMRRERIQLFLVLLPESPYTK